MKTLIALILLIFLLIFSCDKNPTAIKPAKDKITVSTDKNSYSESDSVILFINNTSNYDIIFGYRCTYKNLEMYYQKQEDTNHWSDTLWFDYMSLKCLTRLKTLSRDQTLKHSIFAGEFKSKGKFRLIIPCYLSEKDSSIFLTSNMFEIK